MHALIAVLALSSALAGDRRDGVIGECDPVGGPRLRWSPEAKAEVRARIQFDCKALGDSPIICLYMAVVVERESFNGAAGIRHTLGERENGLGAMGLGIGPMDGHWPGDDEDPAFCRPEVTAIVAHQVIRSAVVKWGARNLQEVQAVYAGRFHSWVDDEGKRHYSPGRRGEVVDDPGLCARVARRRLPGRKQISCWTPITADDVGRGVPKAQRRELADELESRFVTKAASS